MFTSARTFCAVVILVICCLLLLHSNFCEQLTMDASVVEDNVKEGSKKTVTEERSDQRDVGFCVANQSVGKASESNNVTMTSTASISEKCIEPALPLSLTKENRSRDEGNESSETPNPAKNGSPEERRKHHRRKRGRKGSNKKGKPYLIMSKQERDLLLVTEDKQAAEKQEEMLLSGRPVAPINTTQYIMARHSPNTQLDVNNFQPSGYVVYHSSDSPIYNINPDYEDYHEKDFQEDYTEVHRRRLEEMTRAQLVEEHANLEKMQGQLDQELSDLRNQNEEDMKKLDGHVDKDNIEEKLDQVRKRYEELIRKKATLTGSNEDIVLPWEEQFHVSDDDYYNESNLAA